ncbi:MAG: hypothetical protein QM644_14585 [Mobilitalea sp.]
MNDNELTQAESIEIETNGEPSGLSRLLNRYFHHLDRGGTLKGEVMAGITLFFLSICMIFMNMQIVAGAINGNVELRTAPADPINIAAAATYAQIYVGSILIAFIGSLVIGLVARLPFAQLSTMGLASSMLSLLGIQAGLSYYNLLFINLIAAVIYSAVVGIPVIREYVYKALPNSVRKALPVTVGLMIACIALQMSGIVSTSKIIFGNMDSQNLTFITGVTAFTGEKKLANCAFIGMVTAILIYGILKFFKCKHPVFWSLIGGTAVFIMTNGILVGFDVANTESFLNFGRVWIAAASQASPDTPFGDSYLTYFGTALSTIFSNAGFVFLKGADFSSYSGNTIALVVSGVLCYIFVGMYDTEGTLLAVESKLNKDSNDAGKVDFDSQKGIRRAQLCNAGMNVIAPFFGVGGVSVSKSSISAAEDNGKSGLVPIFASVGFLISLFIMAFPVLFATLTYPVGSMNQWNYNAYGNGGFVYLMQGAAFGIADLVMVCVGISTLRTLKKVNWNELSEVIPVIATIIISVMILNLAFGIACGVILFCLTKILSFRKNNLRDIGIPTAVLLVLAIILLFLL